MCCCSYFVMVGVSSFATLARNGAPNGIDRARNSYIGWHASPLEHPQGNLHDECCVSAKLQRARSRRSAEAGVRRNRTTTRAARVDERRRLEHVDVHELRRIEQLHLELFCIEQQGMPRSRNNDSKRQKSSRFVKLLACHDAAYAEWRAAKQSLLVMRGASQCATHSCSSSIGARFTLQRKSANEPFLGVFLEARAATVWQSYWCIRGCGLGLHWSGPLSFALCISTRDARARSS